MRSILTALTVAGLTLTVGTSPATGATPAGKLVSYSGYQVTVPAAWPVIDLAKDPTACVRFDRPAVYLGRSTAQPNCPADAAADRAAGLVIAPLDSPAAGSIAKDGDIQVEVKEAGVLVTAFHSPALEQTVRNVLATGTLASGRKATTTTARTASSTAAAASLVTPGTLKGQAFDACTAPSQATMDAWRSAAPRPFEAVGIYISGARRLCAQPNLTPSWVQANAANGWKFLPLDVGKQAPCSNYSSRMSYDPATARAEGRAAAVGAAQAAGALGIGPRSTIYSDIESYTTTIACRAAVLSYVSGWTNELNTRGYLAGVYTSIGTGGADLKWGYNDARYTRPDSLWFAWYNGKADVEAGTWLDPGQWVNHERVHQYRDSHDETHGGATVNIDSNFVDLTVPPAAVRGFDATGGYTQATLRWTAPPAGDLGQVIVRRNTGTTPPATPANGTAVYAGTGTSATVTGLSSGTTYTFRSWVKDKSGKVGPPADTRLVGTRTTIAISPASLTMGGATTITGRATRIDTGAALAGVPLNLYRRQKGTTAWQLIKTTTTNASGVASYVHKPVWSQDYQWGPNGSADTLGSRSASIAVGVRPVVTASVTKTTMPLGSALLLYGSVSPAHPGQAVYLQRWVGGKWNHVTVGKLTTKSTYMFTIKPTVRGTYAYRVAKPGDVDHLTTTSPMRTFKVT
ncbi:DUF1906 domain-containing protein [Kribbella deserti]|uniref:Glycoside hydrolase domain-containing protein n=1 Tax=Kribbella deserti TaxID=1926257 RepID=A0ABV6QGV9_9ACTN